MRDFVEVCFAEDHLRNAAWLKDIKCRFPREVLQDCFSSQKRETKLQLTDEDLSAIESLGTPEKAEIVSRLRSLRMFTDNPPLSSRMPFSYQLVPPFVRKIVARAIGRGRSRDIGKWAAFPSFPLDLCVDALSDVFCLPYEKLRPTPVLLTHDIDSPEGLKNLPQILKEEETVGARSTNFIVPCSWRIDHGILSDAQNRGHEIGIHGFDHSNKTAFMDISSINRRIDKMRNFIEKYGVSGYRAPSLLRTQNLLRALSGVFRYDSSIPTSGGLFPVPNNGCASARLFQVEGILEIPLTMPRDGTLLFLGYTPHKIQDLWMHCADIIGSSGGIVVLLTHCEKRFSGSNEMIEAYKNVLQHFKSSGSFIFKTCKDVITTQKQTDKH